MLNYIQTPMVQSLPEKQRLCRVQNSLPSVKNRALGKDLLCRVLHSAKTFFVECCTRQRIAPGKEFFAECRALGKGLLCRVPDSRQKRGTRHRMTRATVFGHVLLCRVPVVRHSAKIYFFLKKFFLPSIIDLALGKDLNFFKCLCRVPC